MENSVSDVRDFLNSAREATLELARCKRELQRLEECCMSVSSHAGGVPGSGSRGSRDGALAALCDAREETLAAICRRQRLLRRVGDFIDRLDGPDICRCVLRLRYLEFRRWPEVIRALEQVGMYFSERQIMRRHAEALELAAGLWETEGGSGAQALGKQKAN